MTSARSVGLVMPFLIALASPGQALSAQSVVGLRGGVSSTTYRVQDFRLDVDRRTGLAIGVAWGAPLSSWAGLFIGGMYVQKGFEDDDGRVHDVFATDYVDIPVLFQATVVSGESVSGHLRLGPTISIKVSCNRIATGRGTTTKSPCPEIQPIRRVDYLATGGAGVDLRLTDAVVGSLDAFYSLGLRSIYEGVPDLRNDAFRIEAGIGVVLGR